jgi:hypothetical protein
VKKWLQDGKGLIATKSVSFGLVPSFTCADTLQKKNSAVDAGIKMRPTNEELLSMSPEFDHRWSTFFANAPDKPVVLAIPFAGCVHYSFPPPTFELTFVFVVVFFWLALVGNIQFVDNSSVLHTFLFVFFDSFNFFCHTHDHIISNRAILFLLEAFTSPLDLILMLN